MDKEKRKSNRQFDLEKKPVRVFDLDKEPVEHSVEKNVTTPETGGNPDGASVGGKNIPVPDSSNSKKFWWIIAIVIIAILAFFLTRGCGGSGEETVVPVADSTGVVENVADTTIDSSAAGEDGVDVSSSTEDTGTGANAQSSENGAEQNISAAQQGDNAVSTATEADIQRAADRVLDGEFGNGQERKDKLGSSYAAVQRKVNEMYRKGLAPRN